MDRDTNIINSLKNLINIRKPRKRTKIWTFLFGVICWVLWLNRNELVFQEKMAYRDTKRRIMFFSTAMEGVIQAWLERKNQATGRQDQGVHGGESLQVIDPLSMAKIIFSAILLFDRPMYFTLWACPPVLYRTSSKPPMYYTFLKKVPVILIPRIILKRKKSYLPQLSWVSHSASLNYNTGTYPDSLNS
jgi:hypothetical protein